MDIKDFAPGWLARIASAQTETTTNLGGKTYRRVPHSSTAAARCRDCAVEPGQLHVPTCCVERCPRCMGQAYGCACVEEVLH